MTDHPHYKFSVTVQTDDLAVVCYLRSLAKFSQKTGNNQIPWGGTKDKDWRRDEHCVTLRFTSDEYRAGVTKVQKRTIP